MMMCLFEWWPAKWNLDKNFGDNRNKRLVVNRCVALIETETTIAGLTLAIVVARLLSAGIARSARDQFARPRPSNHRIGAVMAWFATN